MNFLDTNYLFRFSLTKILQRDGAICHVEVCIILFNYNRTVMFKMILVGDDNGSL